MQQSKELGDCSSTVEVKKSEFRTQEIAEGIS